MGDRGSSAFESDALDGRSAVGPSVSTSSEATDAQPQAGRSAADTDLTLGAADPATERERVCAFIERTVGDAAADGVVVAMSGGLDSTVTAALAVEALGSENVYGLILPCNKIGAPHARDAEALADALGIDHDTVHLQPLFAQFGAVAPERFGLHDDPVRSGNAIARLRMTMAYLAANATNRLVCGTGNRSERLLGYVTKYGDGAADLLPLGHLYKTDVRALAAEIDVPQFVVEKPPTAGFLPGQRDEDDLGAPYETIDRVLRLGVDRGLDPEAITERLASTDGVDAATVADLLARHRATAHKRGPPLMLDE
ncbi:NAD+ synthase [Halorubrum sp. BV1]|uniref:NAD+ synthase n=1 Tax=Halorubrum sp. BV1 TaxID=1498500 RepID=UPI0006787E39|nr:NAD+ synthase [Halorubrum sp. BV1]